MFAGPNAIAEAACKSPAQQTMVSAKAEDRSTESAAKAAMIIPIIETLNWTSTFYLTLLRNSVGSFLIAQKHYSTLKIGNMRWVKLSREDVSDRQPIPLSATPAIDPRFRC